MISPRQHRRHPRAIPRVCCAAIVVALALFGGFASPATSASQPSLQTCRSGPLKSGHNNADGWYGQITHVVVINRNFLGLAVTVTETTFGDSQRSVILPYSEHTFKFSKFGESPILYLFDIYVHSNSVVAGYRIDASACG